MTEAAKHGEVTEEMVERAIAAYEAATPSDYRYSAIALRKAIAAALTAAPTARPSEAEPVAWRWRWKDQAELDGWCLSETDPRPGSTPIRMERFAEVQPLYASPSPIAVGAEVKPLEWTGDFNTTAYAECLFGKFAAWIIDGSAYVRAPWFSAGGIVIGKTAEDAKSGAHALLSDRIRSALVDGASK